MGRPLEGLQVGDPEQIGRYLVRARIGAGGMGVVYLGEAPNGKSVAIKVIQAALAEDRTFRDRFRREVAAAKRVRSRVTVAVLDSDPDGENPWVAFEYVEGPNLQEVVDAHIPRLSASVGILTGIAEALIAIHQVGIIHRDLKPSNVLVPPDGVKVIDFGIAAALDATSLTRTGIMGTPAWLAPEQITGEPLTPAVDVFAWGCIALYTTTGRLAFGGGEDSPPVLIYRVVNADPDLSDVPDELMEPVTAALAKKAEDRPTVNEILRMMLPGRRFGPPLAGALLRPADQTPSPGILTPSGTPPSGTPDWAAASNVTPAGGPTGPPSGLPLGANQTPPGGAGLQSPPTGPPFPAAQTPPGGFGAAGYNPPTGPPLPMGQQPPGPPSWPPGPAAPPPPPPPLSTPPGGTAPLWSPTPGETVTVPSSWQGNPPSAPPPPPPGVGGPGWQGAPPPPKKKSRVGLWLGIGGGVLAVLIILGIIGAVTNNKNNNNTVATTVPADTTTTQGPTTTTVTTPGGVTPLSQLLPTDVDPTSCTTNNSPPSLTGLSDAMICSPSDLAGGQIFAFQFDNAADYATSLGQLNKFKGFDSSTAGSTCPPGSDQQDTTGWHNDTYPAMDGQILECLSVGTNNSQPDYIWTYPTENAIIDAQAAANSSFSALDSWWTKDAPPAG